MFDDKKWLNLAKSKHVKFGMKIKIPIITRYSYVSINTFQRVSHNKQFIRINILFNKKVMPARYVKKGSLRNTFNACTPLCFRIFAVKSRLQGVVFVSSRLADRRAEGPTGAERPMGAEARADRGPRGGPMRGPRGNRGAAVGRLRPRDRHFLIY